MVVEFDRRGVQLLEEVDLPFPSIQLKVTSHGSASQAELDQVGAETAKYCAVSKLFVAAGTKVDVTWEKAQGINAGYRRVTARYAVKTFNPGVWF